VNYLKLEHYDLAEILLNLALNSNQSINLKLDVQCIDVLITDYLF